MAVVKSLLTLLVGFVCLSFAQAEVARLEIQSRTPFAGGQSFGKAGPYERIVGRLHLEADPAALANARITDLKYAPRNAHGVAARLEKGGQDLQVLWRVIHHQDIACRHRN